MIGFLEIVYSLNWNESILPTSHLFHCLLKSLSSSHSHTSLSANSATKMDVDISAEFQCIEFMKRISFQPDVHIIHLLIECGNNNINKLWKLYQAMKDMPLTEECFNTFINVFESIQEKDKAMQVESDMKQRNVQINYLQTLEELGKQGKTQQMRTLYDKVLASVYDTRTLNIVLTIVEKYADHETLLEVWRKTRNLRITPDIKSFNIIFEGLSKNNNVNMMEKLLAVADTMEVIPNAQTYQIFLLFIQGWLTPSYKKENSKN